MTRIPVFRTAHCKRCDSENVTWHQSPTTAKWYLTEVFERDGSLESDHRDFHSAYCGKPAKHKALQDEITQDELGKNEQFQKAQQVHEKELDTQNADRLIAWVTMDPEALDKRIEELERKLRYHNANPPTMDFMTDFTRTVAEIKDITTELTFLTSVKRSRQGV